MTAMIGYARVSSSSQSTDTQVDRLKAAGCSVVRVEKASGRSRDGRSELVTVLEFIQPGDTLTVVKLDRLGRSTRDVLNLSMSWKAGERTCGCWSPRSAQLARWARWS